MPDHPRSRKPVNEAVEARLEVRNLTVLFFRKQGTTPQSLAKAPIRLPIQTVALYDRTRCKFSRQRKQLTALVCVSLVF